MPGDWCGSAVHNQSNHTNHEGAWGLCGLQACQSIGRDDDLPGKGDRLYEKRGWQNEGLHHDAGILWKDHWLPVRCGQAGQARSAEGHLRKNYPWTAHYLGHWHVPFAAGFAKKCNLLEVIACISHTACMYYHSVFMHTRSVLKLA